MVIITKDNIIEGPELERKIHSSLGELFLLLLRAHNEKVMQIDATTGEKLQAYVILNRAIELAKWFKRNHIGPGDSISISSENRLEYPIVPLAAFLTGVTFAPLNPEYTVGEATHVLNLFKPKLIICSPKALDRVLAGKNNYPYVKHYVLLGKNNPKHKNLIMYEDIIKGAKTDGVDQQFEATEIDPDGTVAVMLCSSGTTGLPKGVMTTHSNITIAFEIARIVLKKNVNDRPTAAVPEVMTGVAPFFHVMGFMIMLMSIVSGRTLIVYSKFNPKQFLESISKYKVTMLVVPPPIILFLVKHPMVKNYDLSSIKELMCGAAPVRNALENEATTKLKLQFMSQSYGMTESTLTVLVPYSSKYKVGSVGQVVPGMKCKILNKQGRAVGPNEEGELCFHGPLLMKGYINDPKATAGSIDKDNWLHTGDVGYYDEEGYFYIVDRIKELIKYKGFQIAPAELEALLLTHPAVADAAVVGIEDEIAGELPLGFIVKKPGCKVTGDDLEKYVADRVSPTKRLRGGVHFINEIPRNPTGKILRRVLREKATKMMSML